MALRSGHGKGKGVPRIEVLPANEQPVGEAAPARPVALRDSAGRFQPGDGTRRVAQRGGQASGVSRQLARLLGLAELSDEHPFAPYARLAREWRDDQMASVSASVAGGTISPGVASIISTAALQMAASRWSADQGAANLDPKALLEFSRLADASRQNILAAHELAAREAASHKAASGPVDFAAHVARLAGGKP